MRATSSRRRVCTCTSTRPGLQARRTGSLAPRDAFHTITATKLAEFTKPHLANPWCEVEVPKEGTVVSACAILLAWAPKAWSLDKNKLTTLLCAEVPFTVKLMKRSVDKAELEKILEKATGQPQDQPA